MNKLIAFALALMMKHDKLNVRALFAAPFYNSHYVSPEDGMEKSYDEILNLLSLIGMPEKKNITCRGSRTYLPDEKTPVPSCALVGYTNAGKSSLLNAMTNADTLVEDKLFATLDPTTRRMERADGSAILLTDTVGFIRRLPHDLVNAFRSTLEEAALADLVLIVLDASDPEVVEQHRTTVQVLDELGAGDKPRLVVLNKIDRVNHPDVFEGLAFRFKDAIRISARTGDGLEELSSRIDSLLGGEISTLRFPTNRHDLAALVHRNGSAVEEEYGDDAIIMRARLPERVRGQLKEWMVDE